MRPIYIPDEEFEADFTAFRFRNRSTSGKRLRYMLAKIEKQLSGSDITDEGMTATVEAVIFGDNPAPFAYFTTSSAAFLRCSGLSTESTASQTAVTTLFWRIASQMQAIPPGCSNS